MAVLKGQGANKVPPQGCTIIIIIIIIIVSGRSSSSSSSIVIVIIIIFLSLSLFFKAHIFLMAAPCAHAYGDGHTMQLE